MQCKVVYNFNFMFKERTLSIFNNKTYLAKLGVTLVKGRAFRTL